MNFSGGKLEPKFDVNCACFPQKPEVTKMGAKFMNFSFWPFLWFGLPGRLLMTFLGFFLTLEVGRPGKTSLSPFRFWGFAKQSAAEKRGLWEGVVQEPLRRALFCVFLCSEVIFSCKSHRNFFQKSPLQCRHFLENPLAKNPKTQLLKQAAFVPKSLGTSANGR